jgi:hypothetical protein
MSDITDAGPRLRDLNDRLLIGGGMRQTDAEYRAEIARLRLTDEERALLTRIGSDIREWDKYSSGRPWFVTVKDAAIIRGILERLG